MVLSYFFLKPKKNQPSTIAESKRALQNKGHTCMGDTKMSQWMTLPSWYPQPWSPLPWTGLACVTKGVWQRSWSVTLKAGSWRALQIQPHSPGELSGEDRCLKQPVERPVKRNWDPLPRACTDLPAKLNWPQKGIRQPWATLLHSSSPHWHLMATSWDPGQNCPNQELLPNFWPQK